MRSRLEALQIDFSKAASAHAGLLHDRYAPVLYSGEDIGKISQEKRTGFLQKVASTPLPDAYFVAYERWQRALDQTNTPNRIVEVAGRLLIGHGNPAPSEVGISLHRTYGVPFLPASGLKGLLNHYLASWGATVDPRWAGVGYDERGNPTLPPGEGHGFLFGVPNLTVDGKEIGRRGIIAFEDGWLAPESWQGLALDVITPHQTEYYRESGKDWPNDWTDPNPITFLVVPAGTRFRVACTPLGSTAVEDVQTALSHLVDALRTWGAGGKTRAGYGRFREPTDVPHLPTEEPAAPATAPAKPAPRAPAPDAPRSPATEALEAAVDRVLAPFAEGGPSLATKFDAEFGDDHLLEPLTPTDYPAALKALRRLKDDKKAAKLRGDRISLLIRKVSP